MGAKAYTLLENARNVHENGCILEIGSQRGEGSTDYFIGLSERMGIPFYTVDVNFDVYVWVAHKAHAFLMTGEEFMERVFPNMGKRVSVAYLDGFDWIWRGYEDRDFIQTQKKDYKELGLDLNNRNSQKSHLEQAILVDKYSELGTQILFDDTWPVKKGIEYDGKGGLAVPHLLSLGYKIIQSSPVAEQDLTGYVLLEK